MVGNVARMVAKAEHVMQVLSGEIGSDLSDTRKTYCQDISVTSVGSPESGQPKC